MTTSSPSDRDPFTYVDEPSFLARIAWPQVGMLAAIGLATLGPIVVAILLAL